MSCCRGRTSSGGAGPPPSSGRRPAVLGRGRDQNPARGAPGHGKARARGHTALDRGQLEKLRQRYDEAGAFGIIHNRLRDWHDGNHPSYTRGCWPQEYKEQVWLFTRELAVEWTSDSAERAVKGPKRAASP
ncbi:MAG: hypothetical protein ACLPKE_32490 [Streptosporangiaceae bacterium]